MAAETPTVDAPKVWADPAVTIRRPRAANMISNYKMTVFLAHQ